MIYSVLRIAQRFLEIAKSSGKTIDPLKLQKLVYLAHGWNLAFTGQPLVEESFQAWKYGPVSPKLYDKYKKYGGNPIQPKVCCSKMLSTR